MLDNPNGSEDGWSHGLLQILLPLGGRLIGCAHQAISVLSVAVSCAYKKLIGKKQTNKSQKIIFFIPKNRK